MTVLLAEDDEAIANVVSVILKDSGHEVLHASDEKSLMSHITQKPHLILLDISLSGSDGAVLATKLKKDPVNSKIPLVIVSANSETEEIAHESGANGFLLKPFDIDELLALVDKYSA